MPRAKNVVASRRRRKKILKSAKGYWGGKSRLIKTAKESVPPPSAEHERPINTPQDPTKGWGQLIAGGLRIVDVPGSHKTMVSQPYVETLASRIKDCLNY